MLRQYYAQRCCGGDNPLRVGVIAVGSLYFLQDRSLLDGHRGARPVRQTPWIVEAFLNGTVSAARRNPETGSWEDVYCSRRSDMALVRSLRDRRVVRQVTVHTLIAHDDLGLWKEPTTYPSLPGSSFPHRSRTAPEAPPPSMNRTARDSARRGEPPFAPAPDRANPVRLFATNSEKKREMTASLAARRARVGPGA